MEIVSMNTRDQKKRLVNQIMVVLDELSEDYLELGFPDRKTDEE